MFTTLLEVFLGILGLSIVVLAHEFGHLAASRLTGIRVQTFSVGFGKKLLKFQRRETEYCLSLIPLGGYCRFYGEEAFRDAISNNLDTIPGQKDEFFSSPEWKRIIIAISGPLANILFSIAIITIISWIGYKEHYSPARIVLASEYSDDELWPADEAGLQSGDIISAIDGKSIDRFHELRRNIIVRPGEETMLTVIRDDKILDITIIPKLDKQNGQALIGAMSWIDPRVEHVLPGGPADEAGIHPGDIITSINGQEIRHSVDFFHTLKDIQGTLSLQYSRNGKILQTRLNREADEDAGITFALITDRSANLNIFESIARGVRETWRTLRATIKGFRVLFMGIQVHKAVAGPIRLISDTGAVFVEGFRTGIGAGLLWSFELMAFISVSLAFLNLLPIPILDGGQILLFVVNWISPKPLKPRQIHRYQIIGTIMVVIIAVFATTGDLIHFGNR